MHINMGLGLPHSADWLNHASDAIPLRCRPPNSPS